MNVKHDFLLYVLINVGRQIFVAGNSDGLSCADPKAFVVRSSENTNILGSPIKRRNLLCSGFLAGLRARALFALRIRLFYLAGIFHNE